MYNFKILLMKINALVKNRLPFERKRVYQDYFKDKSGVEIGGPSNFFKKNDILPIYPVIKQLDGVNFSNTTAWTGKIDESRGYIIDEKVMGRQYFYDAVDLKKIGDGSYDFILSCNNLKHIANPLKAIREWLRILKDKGLLLIVVPRKESNFDRCRFIVKFSHLMEDFSKDIGEDDETHLGEIIKLHDLGLDSAPANFSDFKNGLLKNHDHRCLHHHVFDLAVIGEIFKYLGISVLIEDAVFTDYIILGQKGKD